MVRYSPRMFIRRTNTRNSKTGEAYFTHRLVEAVRVGAAVKQRTLLNLGAHFDLAQADWAALAGRISELLHGQAALLAVSPVIEAQAQMLAFPGTAYNSTNGCNRSRTNWLVLSTNRF
jgi:hypothetical protein